MRKAYLAFQYAETLNGRRLEDREAYDWLRENGIDQGKGDVGELIDYKLPAFDTWSRQLRNARNLLVSVGKSMICRLGRGEVVQGRAEDERDRV